LENFSFFLQNLVAKWILFRNNGEDFILRGQGDDVVVGYIMSGGGCPRGCSARWLPFRAIAGSFEIMSLYFHRLWL
jgi:hypothetical protein